MNIETLTGILKLEGDRRGADVVVGGLRDYQAASKQAQEQAQAAASGGKALGESLKATAGAYAIATGAALTAGAALLKVGKDYEGGANLIRQRTGETGAALEELKGDMMAVAKVSSKSFEEIAAPMAMLKQRLDITGPPLQALTRQFMQLNSMGTPASIEGFTRAIGDWGIPTDQASKALDRLFVTSQKTGVGIDEIQRLVVQFGAPMRNFGFSFQESSALLAEWQKRGVNTELVMGSLRIASGKFARSGVDLREGLNGAIESIKAAGSSSEATAIAMETFGARAGADMADTIRGGKFEIDSLLKTLDASPDTIGKAAAATRTFDQNLALMKNQASVTLAPLAESFVGMANAVVAGLTSVFKAVQPVLQGFGDLPEPLKLGISLFLGLVTVIGSLLTAAAGAALAWGPMVAGLGSVGITAGAVQGALMGVATTLGAILLPVGAAVAAIAVLKVGHDDAAKSIDEVTKKTVPAGSSLAAYGLAVDRAGEKTSGLGKVWNVLTADLTSKHPNIQRASDQFLKMGLGMSEAAMQSDGFKKQYAQLVDQFSHGNMTQAEYEKRLVAIANASSMAVDHTRLLTGAQAGVADAFAKSTDSLLPHDSALASVISRDESYKALVADLSQQVAVGTVTQQQATDTIKGYVAAREKAAAADTSAAAATQQYSAALMQFQGEGAASSSGVKLDVEGQKQFDDAMQKQKDSQAKVFTEMVAAKQKLTADLRKAEQQDAAEAAAASRNREKAEGDHGQKLVDLEKRLGAARTQAQRDAANSAIAKENEKWTGILARGEAGGASHVAQVKQQYAEEQAAQQEHLAKLAFDQTNAMLQMGQISEGQAKLILGSLQSAFPTADFLDASAAAMIDFSATLGQALGGSEEAALSLGDVILKVPDSIDQAQAKAEEYEQGAVAAYQGASQAAAAHAAATGAAKDQVVAANQAAMTSTSQRAQLTGEAGLAEQGSYQKTGAVATTTASQVGAAHQAVGQSAAAASTGVQAAHGQMAGSAKVLAAETEQSGQKQQAAYQGIGTAAGGVAQVVGGASGSIASGLKTSEAAASATGKAVAGIGEGAATSASQVVGSQAQVKGALAGTDSAARTATASITSMNQATVTSGQKGAAATTDTKKAVEAHATAAVRAGSETQRAQQLEAEQAAKLKTAMEDIPKLVSTQVELKGLDQATRSLQDYQKMLVGAGAVAPGGPPGRIGGPKPPSSLGSQFAASVTDSAPAARAAGLLLGAAAMEGLASAVATGTKQVDDDLAKLVAYYNALFDATPDFAGQWQAIFKRMADGAGELAKVGHDLYGIYGIQAAPGSIIDFMKSAAQSGHIGTGDDFRHFWGMDDQEWFKKFVLEPTRAEQEHLQGLLVQFDELGRQSHDMALTEIQRNAALKEQQTLYPKIVDETRKLEQARYEAAKAEIGERASNPKIGEADKKLLAVMLANLEEWHTAWTKDIDQRSDATARLSADEQAYAARVAAAYKAVEDYIKSQQKAAQDAENSTFDLTMAHLDAEAKRRDRLHDDYLRGLDQRRKLEDANDAAILKAYGQQEDQIKAAAVLRDRELEALKDRLEQAKLDLGIDRERERLDGLKSDVERFKSALGDLQVVESDPKKAREEELKRARERIKLTTDAQRDALRRAVAEGRVAGPDDQRLAAQLLAGEAMNAERVRSLMDRITASYQSQADAQQGVLTAKEKQAKLLDDEAAAADRAAKASKDEDDRQLAAIADKKKAEDERHASQVSYFEEMKAKEDDRYRLEREQMDALRDAAKEAHLERLRQTDEEYAAQLLRLGHTEDEVQAILARQREAARKIADDAAAAYREMIKNLVPDPAELPPVTLPVVPKLDDGSGGGAEATPGDPLVIPTAGGKMDFGKFITAPGGKGIGPIEVTFQPIILTPIDKDAEAKARKDRAKTMHDMMHTTSRGKGGFVFGGYTSDEYWRAWHWGTEDDSAAKGQPTHHKLAEDDSSLEPGGSGLGAIAKPFADAGKAAAEAGAAIQQQLVDPAVKGFADMREALRLFAADMRTLPMPPTMPAGTYNNGSAGSPPNQPPVEVNIDTLNMGDNRESRMLLDILSGRLPQ